MATKGNGACEEHPCCRAPQLSKTTADLVHGGTKTALIVAWCAHERSWKEELILDKQHCGEQANWFEPKETK